MNDILKNRVWRLLPKEYKEDVQSHFKDLNNLYHRILSQDSLTNEDCDCCQSIREKRALYRLYFGEDNLTSAIDDSFFQEIYQAFKEKLYNEKLANMAVSKKNISPQGNFNIVIGTSSFGSSILL